MNLRFRPIRPEFAASRNSPEFRHAKSTELWRPQRRPFIDHRRSRRYGEITIPPKTFAAGVSGTRRSARMGSAFYSSRILRQNAGRPRHAASYVGSTGTLMNRSRPPPDRPARRRLSPGQIPGVGWFREAEPSRQAWSCPHRRLVPS